MSLQTFQIPPAVAGQRVDAFLRTVLPELSESRLRGLFDARDVKLDGVRVRRDALLSPGQTLLVYLPDGESARALSVVYEDADVLLVNKRAGVSVEPDVGGGLSLTDLCAHHVRAADPAAEAPAACHRLDHQTCGLCLFAKHESALRTLQDVFRARTLDKRYVCLVRGMPKPPAAVCKAWLLKDARRAVVRVTDHPVPGARPIVTGYETLEAGPVSRLSVHLVTGRTHQIRAHLAALGHPLLGDDLYGDRAFNREHKARSLKLCAVSLTLDTGGRLPALDGREFRVSPPF